MWKRWLIGGLVLGAVGLLGRQVYAGKVERPTYTVEAARDGWEIRQYAPQIEAQVTVPGPLDDAVSRGFRVLGGYIFGANVAQDEIKMTAPVSATPASQEIKMTAPVSATEGDGGQWTVSFMMPSKWRLDTLPVPEDDRIVLVEVPGRRMAARSFRGWVREAKMQRERAALLADLEAAGIAPVGAATVAQFDPPWVLGPLRHNEILVPLSP